MMLCEDVSFRNMDPVKPEEAITDQEDSLTPGQVSEYVGMEVVLPKRDGYQSAYISHRKRSDDVELIGRHNNNPILDTRVYKNVFSGGKGVDVNRVAEYILTSCDAGVN